VGTQNSAPGEAFGDAGEPDDDGELSGDAMPGHAAPGFSAPASTGKQLALDDFVGKVPVALTFAGTLSADATEALVASFAEAFPEFGRHHVQSLLVVPEPAATIRRRRQSGITIPMLADEDGRLWERYAASGTAPVTVLIDEAGTISKLVEGGTASDHAAAVLAVTTKT
jgi:peroxiredoxin